MRPIKDVELRFTESVGRACASAWIVRYEEWLNVARCWVRSFEQLQDEARARARARYDQLHERVLAQK